MDQYGSTFLLAKSINAIQAKELAQSPFIGPPEPSPFDLTRRVIVERTFEMPSIEDSVRRGSRVYSTR